jgi:hypothetical protein
MREALRPANRIVRWERPENILITLIKKML